MKAHLSGLMPLTLLLAVASAPAWAHKNLVEASIQPLPNPVVDPAPATLTGTLLYTGNQGPGNATGHTLYPADGDPVVGVSLRIEELELGGVGVPCGTAGATWIQIFGDTTNASGQVSTNFDTTGLAGSTICFRTQNPAQGGDHGIPAAQSPEVDLVITGPSACTAGANIAATFAAGDGTPAPGDSGPWSFEITVTACGDLTGVTAQGGANGWAGVVSAVPDVGSVAVRKQTKKNTILLWTIGDMNDGDEAHLFVVVDGDIPHSAPDCQQRFLSGAWSATYSDDGGATYQKSTYSGRVSITVDDNDDGNPDCS